jgi:hypothetical protein
MISSEHRALILAQKKSALLQKILFPKQRKSGGSPVPFRDPAAMAGSPPDIKVA